MSEKRSIRDYSVAFGNNSFWQAKQKKYKIRSANQKPKPSTYNVYKICTKGREHTKEANPLPIYLQNKK